MTQNNNKNDNLLIFNCMLLNSQHVMSLVMYADLKKIIFKNINLVDMCEII